MTGMHSHSKCSEFNAELDSGANPAKNCIGNQLINMIADAYEASRSKADRFACLTLDKFAISTLNGHD